MSTARLMVKIPTLKLNEIKEEKKHPDSPHPKKRGFLPKIKNLAPPKVCTPIAEDENTPRPKQ